MANALVDCAGLLREIGRAAEARETWDQSRAHYEVLSRERPDDLDCRERMASCYRTGGFLYHAVGRFREAEAVLQSGLALYEDLARTNSAVAEYRRRLIDARLLLGELLKVNRPVGAPRAFDGAIGIAAGLMAEDPGSLPPRSALADGLKLRKARSFRGLLGHRVQTPWQQSLAKSGWTPLSICPR